MVDYHNFRNSFEKKIASALVEAKLIQAKKKTKPQSWYQLVVQVHPDDLMWHLITTRFVPGREIPGAMDVYFPRWIRGSQLMFQGNKCVTSADVPRGEVRVV